MTPSPTPYHIQVLRETLSRKQRTNPSYSLRAFARDIGLEPSTLSQVLKGRRPLPLKTCDDVADELRLPPLERGKFLESAGRKRGLLEQLKVSEKILNERFVIDESYYRVIAEWEHYAVLTLLDLPAFDLRVADAKEILAERFGITPLRAEAVLQNLVNAKLLGVEDARFVKVHESVHTTDQISSQALRASHLETLEMGKDKLSSVELELRDFTSINFAFDPGQMPELRAVIREFRNKVGALARAGKKQREIFQLAIQAYPVTVSEKKKRRDV